MKTLRKNIDLDNETIAILQIEATLKGYGSLKPFLEGTLSTFAQKCKKLRPGVYGKIIENRLKKKGKTSNETDYLLSTRANAARLEESRKQDQLGKVIRKKRK
jgi:hypothetical protein